MKGKIKQMKIIKPYSDEGVNKPSEVGSHFADVYDWKVDPETGDHIRVVSGQTNVYEFIQSSKAATDINQIYLRAMSGDPSGLYARGEGIYEDFSSVPDNINEYTAMISKIQNKFDSLDSSIKSLFDNDFAKFQDAVLGGSLDSIIKDAATKAATEKISSTESEVSE